jgi:hypothetical protein
MRCSVPQRYEMLSRDIFQAFSNRLLPAGE